MTPAPERPAEQRALRHFHIGAKGVRQFTACDAYRIERAQQKRDRKAVILRARAA